MVGKILGVILILICSIILIFFSSCGTTRVLVRNGTEQAQTSITVTTNNPTSVSASPSVHLSTSVPVDSLKFK